MLFYNGDHVSSILCKKVVYLIHHVTCGSWMFNLFCILDFLGAFGLIPQFLSRILEIPYDIYYCGCPVIVYCGYPVVGLSMLYAGGVLFVWSSWKRLEQCSSLSILLSIHHPHHF